MSDEVETLKKFRVCFNNKTNKWNVMSDVTYPRTKDVWKKGKVFENFVAEFNSKEEAETFLDVFLPVL